MKQQQKARVKSPAVIAPARLTDNMSNGDGIALRGTGALGKQAKKDNHGDVLPESVQNVKARPAFAAPRVEEDRNSKGKSLENMDLPKARAHFDPGMAPPGHGKSNNNALFESMDSVPRRGNFDASPNKFPSKVSMDSSVDSAFEASAHLPRRANFSVGATDKGSLSGTGSGGSTGFGGLANGFPPARASFQPAFDKVGGGGGGGDGLFATMDVPRKKPAFDSVYTLTLALALSLSLSL